MVCLYVYLTKKTHSNTIIWWLWFQTDLHLDSFVRIRAYFFLKSKISFIIPLGTIPSTGEGIVTRQACQRGFSDCCSTSYDIKVRNCGRYTAYCLKALSTCPARYCFGKHIWFLLLLPNDFFPGARDIFRLLASSLGWYFIGTGQCNSEESKDSDKNGNNKLFKKGVIFGFSWIFCFV